MAGRSSMVGAGVKGQTEGPTEFTGVGEWRDH